MSYQQPSDHAFNSFHGKHLGKWGEGGGSSGVEEGGGGTASYVGILKDRTAQQHDSR